MLLKCAFLLEEDELHQLVRPTIDFVASFRMPSGNFPSSIGSHKDRLVQWCHGSPGIEFMFAEAAQVFTDARDHYKELAKECAEFTWKYGLLKKGGGLCHGIAGNAYTFVNYHRLSQDPIWWTRVLRYALKCIEWNNASDCFMEGLCGVLYFLVDIRLHEAQACFPLFELI